MSGNCFRFFSFFQIIRQCFSDFRREIQNDLITAFSGYDKSIVLHHTGIRETVSVGTEERLYTLQAGKEVPVLIKESEELSDHTAGAVGQSVQKAAGVIP